MTYEQELAGSFPAVLREADALHDGGGRLERTYRRLAQRLDDAGIAHGLVGGYALVLHGVRRFTEDIDVLLRPADHAALCERLLDRGYAGIPGNDRSLRDAETGVRIDFVLAGAFPGDGQPKGVAFPDPVGHTERRDRVQVVDLKTLIELKLASGMTAPHRLQDLADVQRLIAVHRLGVAYARELHESVRGKFVELVGSLSQADDRPSG